MARSAAASASSPLPRIRVLATGGTIAGAQTSGTGRGYQSAKFSIDALIAAVPQLSALARVDVEQVAALGSQDMNEAVWLKLAARTSAALALPDHVAAVVTHGTDTMVETGRVLKQRLTDLIHPVILTGAMTPLGFERSDGLQNLTESLFAARTLTRGVWIVIHGQVFDVDHVRKDRERARFMAT